MTAPLDEFREFLTTTHTRVLLQALQRARVDVVSPAHLEALKEELSRREHVPNKAEAKQIRQERAKAQRSR